MRLYECKCELLFGIKNVARDIETGRWLLAYVTSSLLKLLFRGYFIREWKYDCKCKSFRISWKFYNEWIIHCGILSSMGGSNFGKYFAGLSDCGF